MPLFDHLGELRRRMVIVVVCWVVAACVLYIVTPQLIQFLVEPIKPYLDMAEMTGGNLIITTALGGFAVRFKVAAFVGIMVTAPIIIWQFLAFFLPALKPKERKWFIPTFAVGVVLFIFGTVFCYYIILDPAFEWMLNQTSGADLLILPDAEAYLRLVILFEIGFGVAFELPLVVFYLIVFNVVPYKVFRRNWRTIYVILMVICAMITPDANPITMILMFAAMAGLYELSLFISRVVLSNKIKAQNDKLEAEEKAAEAGITLKEALQGKEGTVAPAPAKKQPLLKKMS